MTAERHFSMFVQRSAMTLAFLFGVAVAVPELKAATTYVLSFQIDDSLSGSRVASDGINGGWYKDYRLSSGDPADPDYCVEASPGVGGSTFIRFNRKLDGDAGYQFCEPWAPGAHQRQFTLNIDEPTGSACNELALNNTGTPATYPETGCYVTGYAHPRMRLGNLYANKGTKTPVAFLLAPSYEGNPVSYEIRSETDVPMTVWPDGNTREVISKTQQFRLWRFADGSRAIAVASPFGLPFRMAFQRTGI